MFKMIIYYNFNALYVLIFFKLTGAHTQHIERDWREVRGNIPRYGTREGHVLGYLAEYLFKRAYSRLERIETFFLGAGTGGEGKGREPPLHACITAWGEGGREYSPARMYLSRERKGRGGEGFIYNFQRKPIYAFSTNFFF